MHKTISSKFFALFITLIVLIILIPFASDTKLGQWILSLSYSLSLVAMVYAVRNHSKLFLLFVALALLNIIAISYNHLLGSSLTSIIQQIAFGVFCLTATVIILQEVFHENYISGDTVFGALCGYLLIGILFATIYMLIYLFIPNAYNYAQQDLDGFQFIYFSFVTLTTLGYGDITPIADQAKAFVIIESITGIFYLATLVARLISLRK